jgi:hypothetical protein
LPKSKPRTYSGGCDEDAVKQHEPPKLILDRILVEDDKVVALTLKADGLIVLGHKTYGPTSVEVDPLLQLGLGREGTWAHTCTALLSCLASFVSAEVQPKLSPSGIHALPFAVRP